ncbi:hypothetical protein PINS_up011060 [Pythium insidiosum]|nr:hypothetical protein PINS_up011060 [Pythium insidiosum]
MDQMIPSYDGRLYHIAGSSVRELEMTMLDIINANGPVRPARSHGETTDQDEPLRDLLLVGEKQTKMFTLDATHGRINPLFNAAGLSKQILFGRAEFKTRIMHASNASVSRCLTISEYFLQFSQHPHCAVHPGSSRSRRLEQTKARAPELVVVPKDLDMSVSEDDESTIAAFDPWTHEQLWEVQLPHFDVIAVFGVSAARGATFFQWNLDGPSTSASTHTKPAPSQARVESHRPNTPSAIGFDTNTDDDTTKQLTRVVPVDKQSLDSQFRLRLLGDIHYLEQADDRLDYWNDGSAPRRQLERVRKTLFDVHPHQVAQRHLAVATSGAYSGFRWRTMDPRVSSSRITTLVRWCLLSR